MIRQLSTSFSRLASSRVIKTENGDSADAAAVESSLERPPPRPTFIAEDDEEVEEDEGRASLEKTVRARDATITTLDKDRHEKEQELKELEKELEQEQLKQMQESILHRLEVERLQTQTDAMEERLHALERDMQDKDAIHEYANLIKGVAPTSGVDSQYVMKLQSQLAKAMKKMEATSHQMELVEQSCNEVVASLKSEIAEVVEDRCRTELDLRKQLELLEEQKETLRQDYDEQIRKNQEEMERLKQLELPDEEEVSDLETELKDAEAHLEDLNRTYEKQEETIQKLTDTLENT